MAEKNNPFGAFTQNFYTDLLEDAPQTAFQGAIPFAGMGFQSMQQPERRQRDYWSDQYSNIYNEYLGQRGQGIMQLAQGQEPQKMQSFSEYLKDVPFTERYGALTPQQKGKGIRSFAPQTRHLYF